MTQPAQTNRAVKAGLVIAGFIVGLLVTELVLRMALPPVGYRFPSFRMTDDRIAMRAGRTVDDQGVRYAFDADGFRTTDTIRDEIRRTVLFIGDSFTEGMGVAAEHAFPAVTRDRLKARGMNARCLNAGVSGFGTAHELRLLQKLLQRTDLAIDAVVFQVLPNNDLRDNWEDGGFGLENGNLVVFDPPRIPPRVWWRDALLNNAFARNSRIVTLIANASFNGVGMDPHYDDTAFALERRLLREVASTAQQHAVPLVFLLVAAAWEHDRQALQPFDERTRLDFVAQSLEELRGPWIDSRRIAAGREHYIPGDGHFSVAGNALIGEALAVRLASLLR